MQQQARASSCKSHCHPPRTQAKTKAKGIRFLAPRRGFFPSFAGGGGGGTSLGGSGRCLPFERRVLRSGGYTPLAILMRVGLPERRQNIKVDHQPLPAHGSLPGQFETCSVLLGCLVPCLGLGSLGVWFSYLEVSIVQRALLRRPTPAAGWLLGVRCARCRRSGRCPLSCSPAPWPGLPGSTATPNKTLPSEIP
ncbi:hypothetical protein EDB80DRAFT_278344 [Ilyonectria destructans]|nr:hypothetical protein EDB80DRAFT_278344 [Ilyonectria destructans]